MAELKIPLTTLVLGSAIAGCNTAGDGSTGDTGEETKQNTDPIVGDWNLVSVEMNADGYSYDFVGTTYTYSEQGQDEECGSYSYDYEITIQSTLSVDSVFFTTLSLGLSYSFTSTFEYCENEGDADSYSHLYSGLAVVEDSGSYTIPVENQEASLQLNCSLESANLNCNFKDWFDESERWFFEFERAEP